MNRVFGIDWFILLELHTSFITLDSSHSSTEIIILEKSGRIVGNDLYILGKTNIIGYRRLENEKAHIKTESVMAKKAKKKCCGKAKKDGGKRCSKCPKG